MKEVLTTCAFCSCGCALYVIPESGKVAGLCPSSCHPVATSRLCYRGWNGIPAMMSQDRLTTPLIRRTNGLEPASWDEAISFAASRIKKILSESGPEALGIIGSARTTNEECYSLVKFARGILGTPNIDGACRFSDAAAVYGLLETSGIPASQVTLNLIPEAKAILVVGANVTEQLPHVGSRIEDAYDSGCQIVVVDPRTSRLAPYAALFLHPKPGTDLLWARALLKTILQRKLFVENVPQIQGFEELLASLADFKPELSNQCGLSDTAVEQMADLLAGTQPIVMFGLGALQQANSTELVKALADIAIALGGKVMPLRRQNNAQGACDVGLVHDLLPGYASFSDPVARKTWESVWKHELPSAPGLSAVEMIHACESGKLKGLLIFGENVALSAPNSQRSCAALDKVEFLAVADIYPTETASMADVVFPACSFLEKDGTFTNIERRVQRVRKVFEPVGQSKSDLQIIADLAAALGSQMTCDPAEVMSEIASSLHIYKSVSYEKLGESWAEPWEISLSDAKLVVPTVTYQQPDGEYPFRLIASRVVFPHHTGTMATRSGMLLREYPESYAELNRADAERLGVRAGATVKISSKSGELSRVLVLNDGVPEGCVHVPHFFEGDSPNVLTSDECAPRSGVPIYKACAVKVEAVK